MEEGRAEMEEGEPKWRSAANPRQSCQVNALIRSRGAALAANESSFEVIAQIAARWKFPRVHQQSSHSFPPALAL